MNIENAPLFAENKNTRNYLKELTKSEKYVKYIVSVQKYDTEFDLIRIALQEYEKKHPYDNKITSQSGRVWIMVGRNGDDELVSLNVGQSKAYNFIKEIQGIIKGIINKNEVAGYYKLCQQYDELEFYEINTDSFIHSIINEDDAKNLAYELVKDYLTESLAAQLTASKHWNKCDTNMDGRVYEHFKDKQEFKK